MKGSWKVKVISGFSVLAIAGTSAAVLAAEQSKARQALMQEQMLLETAEAVEKTQTSEEEKKTGEDASQDNWINPEEQPAAETQTQENQTVESQAQDGQKLLPPGYTKPPEEGKRGTEAKTSNIHIPLAVTEEEIDAYFDGTVLVGDSVMVGFRNYAMRRANTYLGRIQFLASGSFSVHNALWPINAKSVHPIYQGQQRQVWESLGMIQPRRVFLFFGLNDMNMGTLENTCETYAQVIANIKSACPDAEIHLMSMTYTIRGKGKGNLQNPNIRQFNEMLKQMARDNGWGFVDIANPLADANGDLAPAYCSDNYVHQTNAAYDVWSVVLRDYARSQLDETAEFFVGEKKPLKIDGEGFGTNSGKPNPEEETSSKEAETAADEAETSPAE